MMDTEDKEANSRCSRMTQNPTTPTSPCLNLMEQLLLAKIERQSVSDNHDDNLHLLTKNKSLLLRTDSMDSQTSTSTFGSIISNESASFSRYCKCDDCLLGIVDKYQQNSSSIGRKKVIKQT